MAESDRRAGSLHLFPPPAVFLTLLILFIFPRAVFAKNPVTPLIEPSSGDIGESNSSNPVLQDLVTPPANPQSGIPLYPPDAKPEVQHSLRPESLSLTQYVVQQGDTLSGIAKAFGLKQNSIIWANPDLQANPDRLSVGQELWIPPADGVVHTIRTGDTLYDISRRYEVTLEDILGCVYNPILDPDALKVGERILVPGGTFPARVPVQTVYSRNPPADAPQGSGSLIWPVRGSLTQYFHAGHPAIDIATRKGTPVAAADAGTVIRAGWDGSGYGLMVVIEHSNGMQTLYAHLNDVLVEVGASVAQGDTIGTVGTTGRATGSHLHFGVIVNQVCRDPLGYLP